MSEHDRYRVEIKVTNRPAGTESWREGETLTEATFDAATLGGITDAVRLVAGAVEGDLCSYGAARPKRIEWTDEPSGGEVGSGSTDDVPRQMTHYVGDNCPGGHHDQQEATADA